MHLFIFGLGYSSLAVARLAMERGFKISGTTRSEEKAQWLRAQGVNAQVGLAAPDADVTHILSSVPPQEQGDIILPLIAESPHLHLAYFSTTGVYGDWGGEWVDETSETRPNNERLSRRVAAEKSWLMRGGHVFRLAGIYGPGRSVIEDIREGSARRVDKPGQVFSRIHVMDIARTLLSSMENPQPGNVYNVCDDLPAPAHEVVEYGCQLLGVKPPPLIPFKQAELSPMGQEFYSANRRVSNMKIKENLGIQLRFPTYREGLAQCLQSSPPE